MGMQVGESKGGAMAEMNVVPLIDILLVLLIIFMVITPLTPKGLDTLVPQPNPNQKQDQELENKTVVVQVLTNGKVKINNEDSSWDNLGPRHRDKSLRTAAEKIAFVKGDSDVLFGEVAPAPLTSCVLRHRQSWTDHRQARGRSIEFLRVCCPEESFVVALSDVRVLLAGNFPNEVAHGHVSWRFESRNLR